MVVSDHEKAYSGHLEKGCRVLYLAEVVIVELDQAHLQRVRNEKEILKLIGD
jgi:predicted DNA-binding protein with PD1-like motif